MNHVNHALPTIYPAKMFTVNWKDNTQTGGIFTQDNPTFYKDEGGKSQGLLAVVTLKRSGPPRADADAAPITLVLSLAFEQKGSIVHCIGGNQDAFVTFDKDHYEISEREPVCTILFRIEQVSRNFNNQRFILTIRGPDGEEHSSPAICVKSKRKRGTRRARVRKMRRLDHASTRTTAPCGSATGAARGATLEQMRELLREMREMHEDIREIKEKLRETKTSAPMFYDVLDTCLTEVDW